jgi:spectinomycin phosphotransferase
MNHAMKWPGRVFSPQEWQAFLAGYGQHIRLSDEELNVWDDLLLCAWIDEALWLLREDEAGWKNDGQSGMLMSLLSTSLASFAVAR